MPLEIKCGLFARPKLDQYAHAARNPWRSLGWGTVTFVNNHHDCEPSIMVEFAGGQQHVWWASQLELSEWIDPLDCVFS